MINGNENDGWHTTLSSTERKIIRHTNLREFYDCFQKEKLRADIDDGTRSRIIESIRDIGVILELD